MKIFEPIEINDLKLKNRLVMPPMCMYQVKKKDGFVTDFHRSHYHIRAIGQVGLIIVESTGISPEGRISSEDLGIYLDEHVKGLSDIVSLAHREGSKIAIQLNHAGRKSTSDDPIHYGPSPLQSSNSFPIPTELSKADIQRIVQQFKDGARRAKEAGFDGIEIHGAHGYLIHQFLSPISNQRTDEYGTDKVLFLKEVIEAIKSVFDKTLLLRVSADEFHTDGYDVHDMIDILKEVEDDLDIIHVSSGGNVRPNKEIKVEPGYQVYLSEMLRNALKKPTIAVGLLNTDEEIVNVLENEQADLVACGRELLRDSNLFLRLAKTYGREDLIPYAYKRAYR